MEGILLVTLKPKQKTTEETKRLENVLTPSYDEKEKDKDLQEDIPSGWRKQ